MVYVQDIATAANHGILLRALEFTRKWHHSTSKHHALPLKLHLLSKIEAVTHIALESAI